MTQRYYLPVPPDLMKEANNYIGYIVSSDAKYLISIVPSSTGSRIVYDHWEDGYEPDLNSPTQTTTLVWGDGNTTNGIPPGYSTDTLVAGKPIVLEDSMSLPRNASQIFFDSPDHFGADRPVAVVLGGIHPLIPGELLGGAVEVADVESWGRTFVAPIGVDADSDNSFAATALMIQGGDLPADVRVDADADGLAELTNTLGQGQSWLVTGSVVGASVAADQPVQVQMITGDAGEITGFVSRWYKLAPTPAWGERYCTPVSTVDRVDVDDRDSDNETDDIVPVESEIYLHNPGDSDLVLNGEDLNGSWSVTVPPRSTVRRLLPKDSGTCVSSANGERFYGLTLTDKGRSQHDWGASLINECSLYSQILVGFGRGSGNGTENGNPVWVTPLERTRLHIDYDGDPTTGPLVDPFGNRYDLRMNNVEALASVRIYDTNDNNQTGMRVYTVDGTLIAAAYGQDGGVAKIGRPFLDLGTAVLPVASSVLSSSPSLLVDLDGDGRISPEDVVEIRIDLLNDGLVPLEGLYLEHTMPAGLEYATNSTLLNGVLVPDDPAPATPFPFDDGGGSIPDLGQGGSLSIRFQGRLRSDWSLCHQSITNASCILAPDRCVDFDLQCFTSVDAVDVITDLALGVVTQALPGCWCPGAPVPMEVVVENTGTLPMDGFRIEVPGAGCVGAYTGLPIGATQVLVCALPPGTNWMARLVADTNSCLAGYSTSVLFDVSTPPPLTPFSVTVSNGTLECGEPMPAAGASNLVVVGGCGSLSVTVRTERVDSAACPGGDDVGTHTYHVTDLCGRVRVATQVFTWVDTEAPEILSCPSGAVVRCLSDVPPATPGAVVAADVCSTGLVMDVGTVTQGVGNAACALGGLAVEHRYAVRDDCGNTSVCTQRFDVVDDVAPVIGSCPSGATVNCVDQVPSPDPGAVVMDDGCGMGVATVEVDVVVRTFASRGCAADPYVVDHVYRAVDHCGNSSACTQRFTVVDDVAPVVTYCPSGSTVRCEDEIPAAAPGDLVVVDCHSTVVSVARVADGGLGCADDPKTVEYHYRVSDECGNLSVCTQRYVIVDDVAPVIVACASGGVLACADELPPPAPGQLQIEDCNPTTVRIDRVDGDLHGCTGDPGTIDYEYTVFDVCGNSSVCTQRYEIVDDVAPVILSCPPGARLACVEDLPAPTPADVVASDCSAVTVRFEEFVRSTGRCAASPHVVEVVYTVEDVCGNVAVCTQRFEVADERPPVILDCPAGTVVVCGQSVPAPVPDEVVFTDSCGTGGVTVVVTVVDRTMDQPGCVGFVDYEYAVVDVCGNSAVCTQRHEVVADGVLTLVECPPDTTAACVQDIPGEDPAGVVVTGGCSVAGVTVRVQRVIRTLVASTCAGDPYQLDYIYTAEDDCGATVVCTQRITVIDDVAPVILDCPTGTFVSCADQIPPPDPAAVDYESLCQGETATVTVVTVERNPQSRGCGTRPGLVDHVYRVTDACGNFSECTQRFLVVDNVNPTIVSCPTGGPLRCVDDLPPPTPGDVVVADCHATTVTANRVERGGAGCAGSPRVIETVYFVQDVCGNTSVCTQRFEIVDDVAPVILNCPTGARLECLGQLPPPVAATNIAASDCGAVTVRVTEVVRSVGGCPAAPHVVDYLYAAEDDCGNLAVCTQRFVVVDERPPEILDCPAGTVVLCGEVVPPPAPTDVVFSDGCGTGGVTVAVTVVDSRLDQPGCTGAVEYEYAVSDRCGNTSVCTQRHEVVADGPFVLLDCPADVTVACAEDMPLEDPAAVVVTGGCSAAGVTVRVQRVLRTLDASGCAGDPYRLDVVYAAEDACGAVVACTQRITVIDDVAPVIFDCPTGTFISCADQVPAPDPAAVDYELLCHGESATVTVVTIDRNPGSSGCGATPGVIDRVYRITDHCGNVAECTQRFLVVDTESPTVVACPSGGVLQCIDELPAPAPGDVVASDCHATTVTSSRVERGGAGCAASPRIVDYVYTVQDACGNTSVCTQRFEIVDDVAPVISTCPRDMTILCTEPVPAAQPRDVVHGDGCSSNTVTVQVVDRRGEQPGCAGVIEYVYEVADACGNTSVCTQRIEVVPDGQLIVRQCPADAAVVCLEEVPPPNPDALTFAGGCSAAGATTTVQVVTQSVGATGCPGDAVRIDHVYRVEDDCGNVAVCTQRIILIDDAAPVILACPSGGTVGCVGDVPSPDPGAVDYQLRCAGETATVTVTTVERDPGAVGCVDRPAVIDHVYRVTDACGNAVECVQTFVVVDGTAPAILSCPTSLLVQCAEPIPAPRPGDVQHSDGCGTATTTVRVVDRRGESPGCVGVLDYVYTVTDPCGNASECTQRIEVVSDGGLVIVGCLADTNLVCREEMSPPDPGAVRYEGGCGAAGATVTVQVVTQAPAAAACAGDPLRVDYIYQVVDDCGNSASCTQRITVVDDVAPTILDCPSGSSLACIDQLPPPDPAAVAFGLRCASEVASVSVITVERDPGAFGCAARPRVVDHVYRVTDRCGNSAVCTQRFVIVDDAAPSIVSCPSGGLLRCIDELPAAAPEEVVAEDCQATTVSVRRVEVGGAGCAASPRVVDYVYRVVDPCGNSADCTQRFVIVDAEAPIILSCPQDERVFCTETVPAPRPGDLLYSEGCGIGTVTVQVVDRRDEQPGCAGIIEYVYEVADACGNTSACTQRIEVVPDGQLIIRQCPVDATYECLEEVPPPDPGSIVFAGGCSAAGATSTVDVVVRNPGAAGCPGDAVRIDHVYRVEDDCGNVAVCTQRVILIDDAAPVILACPSGGTVGCVGDVPSPDPGAVDYQLRCAGETATVTVTTVERDPGAVGCVDRPAVIDHVYRVTDACGNAVECVQTFVVVDGTAPTILSCPTSLLVQCAEPIPAPRPGAVQHSDGCGAATTTVRVVDRRGESPGCVGVLDYIYTVTDPCGNASECTQRIEVVSDGGLVIVGCLADTNLVCREEMSPPDPGAVRYEGGCGAAGATVTVQVVTQAPAAVACAGDPLRVDYIYQVVDDCGNSASCTQRITVVDDVAPTILDCPSGSSLACIDELPPPDPAAVAFGLRCASEVASVSVITVERDPGAFGCAARPRVVDHVYRVTDRCGNSAVCTQRFVIVDDAAPSIVSCPSGGLLRCIDELPAAAPEEVVAEDCQATTVSVRRVEVGGAGCAASPRVVDYVYRVVDPCGNSADCTQRFVIVDAEAPIILSCPQDERVFCTETVPAPRPGDLLYSEGCGAGTVTVQVVDRRDERPGCAGIIEYVYEVADACGNTSACTQRIEVVPDGQLIIRQCPVDATYECLEEVPPPDPGSIVFAGGCSAAGATSTVDVVIRNPDAAGCPDDPLRIAHVFWVVDDCGGEVACTQRVTVANRTAPTILDCPAGATVECVDDLPAPRPGDVLYTVHCAALSAVVTVVTNERSPTALGCAQAPRVVDYEYRVTDSCGNTSLCTQRFTVVDTARPVILSCPTGATLDCASALPPPDPAAVVVEDCNAVEVYAQRVDRPFGRGCPGSPRRVEYHYTVVDACGRAASCAQVFDIVDAVPPVLRCPNRIELTGAADRDCRAQLPQIAVDMADGCGTVRVDQVPPAGTWVSSGEVVRIVATDACGNAATCGVSVAVDCVVDPVPPVPGLSMGVLADAECVCPGSEVPVAVVVTNSGDMALRDLVIEVMGIDTCLSTQGLLAVGGVLTGACEAVPLAGLTVFVSADSDGGPVFAARLVDVAYDLAPPRLAATASVTRLACGEPPPPPPPPPPMPVDLCGDVTSSFRAVNLDGRGCAGSPAGVEYRYRFADACGHAVEVVHRYETIDETAPDMDCPPDVVLDLGEGSGPDRTGVPLVLDDCAGAPEVWYVDTAPRDDPVGRAWERVWSARDACGNIAVCTQRIAVADSTPPTFFGVGDLELGWEDFGGAVFPVFAFDDSGVAPVVTMVDSDQTPADSCPYFKVVGRVWTATDAVGNQSVHTQRITYADRDAPAIRCPAVHTVECEAGADAALPKVNDAIDPAPVFWSEDETITVIGNTRLIMRSWYAEDACGNRAVCYQVVRTRDTETPAITPPSDAEVACGEPYDVETLGWPTVTDNCDPNPRLWYEDAGSLDGCAEGDTVVRRWIALDASGNRAERIQRIRVRGEAPIVLRVPEARTVGCGDPVDPGSTGTATASFHCAGAVTFEDDIASGDCPGAQTIVRTWIARDDCGHAVSNVQRILIADTAPPVMETPPDLLLSCGASTNVGATGRAGAADLCDGEPLVWHEDQIVGGGCAGTFRVLRRWWAEDGCGNRTLRTQTIDVVDDEAPEFESHPVALELIADTGDCLAGLPVLPADVEDHCGEVTILQSPAPGTLLPVGRHAVNIWAIDDCGNTSGAEVVAVDVRCGSTDLVERDPAQWLRIEAGVSSNPFLACGAGQHVSILPGGTVMYCYRITNLGDEPLRGVAISDPGARPVVAVALPGLLAPGATWTTQVRRVETAARVVVAEASAFPYASDLGLRPSMEVRTALEISMDAGQLPASSTVVGGGAISGVVWQDLSNDADPGRANLAVLGLADIDVNLWQARGDGWRFAGTARTGAGGVYSFESLGDGEYFVALGTNGVPVGSVFSTPDRYEVQMTGTRVEANFGLAPAPTAVRVESFAATRAEGGVRVSWTSAFERDVLAYVVKRWDSTTRTWTELPLVLADSVDGRYEAVDASEPAASLYELWELSPALDMSPLVEAVPVK